jgi:glycerol-3-phosphate O-acyltransferase
MSQPLVLLNLLIAIISIAHSRIEAHKVRNSYAQLNLLILENELFLPWNRDENKRAHMIVAESRAQNDVSYTLDQDSDEKERKIAQLTTELEKTRELMAAQTAFFEKAVDQKLDAFRSELSSSLRQDSSVIGIQTGNNAQPRRPSATTPSGK